MVESYTGPACRLARSAPASPVVRTSRTFTSAGESTRRATEMMSSACWFGGNSESTLAVTENVTSTTLAN